MALRIESAAAAPSPVVSETARSAALPRDPGRATELLYRRHGRTVFRFAWHLLGRREDAEDATQATFLAIHGALTRGTVALEPGAWVLAIARNECMSRLRRTCRTPFQDALSGDSDPVAEGGVESEAELRDELRTARRTLRLLPEPQREAFLMREWLGLESSEVALALGIAPAEVDQLTGRARRSLVLAVGGLEPAIGCGATRSALEAGTLGRAAKVHLLRCPVCRGVRRALQPRAETGAPVAAVAKRLAGILPGFGAGGGAIAALAAKTTAAPVLTKAAALIAAGLLAGGAVERAVTQSHPAHARATASIAGRGGAATQAATAADPGHAALAVLTVPSTPSRGRAAFAALVSPVSEASRGGGARRAAGGHSRHRLERGDARAGSSRGGERHGGSEDAGRREDASTSGADGRDAVTRTTSGHHGQSGDGTAAVAGEHAGDTTSGRSRDGDTPATQTDGAGSGHEGGGDAAASRDESGGDSAGSSGPGGGSETGSADAPDGGAVTVSSSQESGSGGAVPAADTGGDAADPAVTTDPPTQG